MSSKENPPENADKESREGGQQALIEIELLDRDVAKIIYHSLLPELLNPPSYRSDVKILLEGRHLKIKILSRDLVSLRAALNSYLRWLSVIVEALEVIKDELGGY